MKITVSQLRRLIKEEVSKTLFETAENDLIKKYRTTGLTKDVLQIFAPKLLNEKPSPELAKKIASVFNRLYLESDKIRKTFRLTNPESASIMLEKNYKEVVNAIYNEAGPSHLRDVIKKLAEKPDEMTSLIMAISGDMLKRIADQLSKASMSSYEYELDQAYSKGKMGKFDADPEVLVKYR